MQKPNIIIVPNPILKEKTEKVSSFDSVLKNQIEEMVRTLRKEGGVGLAANQIGYQNQVIVVEFKPTDPSQSKDSEVKPIPLTIYINPEIIEFSEKKENFEEGCLSVPKIELEVLRPSAIKIKYQNERGLKKKSAPKGILARILQHEVNHLNGIIFIELAKKQFFEKNPNFKDLKILFVGSGDFASVILEGLIHLGLNLDILTEKAKPAGRDQTIKITPVAETAKRFGKEYREISDFGLHASLALRISDFDLLICSDFGKIIPNSILNMVRMAPINIHPSLLPKYRGPSPIQTAILKGDKKTGVSIIKMTDKIDKGPILAQFETDVQPNDDFWMLRDRLATSALKLLVKVLPPLAANKIEQAPQDPQKASYTKIFKKEAGLIDWKKKPPAIERQIRAFYPWPGSFTYIDDKRLIIHKAHLAKSSDLRSKFSKLVLDCVQLEGKKPTSWQEFLRGYRGPRPEWFKKIKI